MLFNSSCCKSANAIFPWTAHLRVAPDSWCLHSHPSCKNAASHPAVKELPPQGYSVVKDPLSAGPVGALTPLAEAFTPAAPDWGLFPSHTHCHISPLFPGILMYWIDPVDPPTLLDSRLRLSKASLKSLQSPSSHCSAQPPAMPPEGTAEPELFP